MDDRIALVGNTFLEREQREGYLETAITLSHPRHKLTFRNLGWSGDTVDGQARAFFGPPSDGYKHLMSSLDNAKPTVILVNYGLNASYGGEASLNSFRQGYRKLLGDLKAKAPRVVVVTPLPLQQKPKPLPDISAAQANLALYANAIRELAGSLNLEILDLHALNLPANTSENGVHLTPAGYRTLAQTLYPAISFEETDQLRALICAKNALFFHQFRPQNETYLRGFRKHEQGQNAKELPQFDPLITEKEAAIHTAAQAQAKDSK